MLIGIKKNSRTRTDCRDNWRRSGQPFVYNLGERDIGFLCIFRYRVTYCSFLERREKKRATDYGRANALFIHLLSTIARDRVCSSARYIFLIRPSSDIISKDYTSSCHNRSRDFSPFALAREASRVRNASIDHPIGVIDRRWIYCTIDIKICRKRDRENEG